MASDKVYEVQFRRDEEVVLADLACSTRLRLTPDALFMMKDEQVGWLQVTTGAWSTKDGTKWDSDDKVCLFMQKKRHCRSVARGEPSHLLLVCLPLSLLWPTYI